MKIYHEDIYTLAPGELFAVFTDRAFYEERYAKSEGETEFVHFGPRGGRFVIDVRRHVRMRAGAKIPAIAQRFVRDVNVFHTVMEWDLSKGESHRGTYRFEIERVPVEVAGHMHLEPHAAGARNRIEANVRCSIPLVGGKIAEMLGEKAGGALKKDYESTLAYLRDKGLVTA